MSDQGKEYHRRDDREVEPEAPAGKSGSSFAAYDVDARDLGQTTVGSSTARSAESGVAASDPRGRIAGSGPVSIGVGPVIMPGYLDRTQIVTRSGPDRVKLASFHRWAEPLE